MNQCRHNAFRVEPGVFGIELLAFKDVDLVPLPFKAFLGEPKSHLGGAGGITMVIEFQHLDGVPGNFARWSSRLLKNSTSLGW